MLNKLLSYFGYQLVKSSDIEEVAEDDFAEDSRCTIQFFLFDNNEIDIKIMYDPNYIESFARLLFELNTGMHYTSIVQIIKQMAEKTKPEEFGRFVDATQKIITATANDNDNEPLVDPLDVIHPSHNERVS